MSINALSVMDLKNRPNIKREIAAILVFKAIAIFIIWMLFFSHPLDKKLTPNTVSQHLLGAVQSKDTNQYR
ncbi:MAG: hypothetical protein K0U29_03935 [Gammaproteobacteria bacterium]|nr:hypothetical protein [Gammaproteobacteria bacterium]MCH9744064.1 hypothetical protein [Gammaproteobacteria bacterium]